jgi:hypothetical protein
VAAVPKALPHKLKKKVALKEVFSEYFGFPCQSSFYQFLHNHHHLSSGAGTINRPVVAAVPKAPPHKLKKKVALKEVFSEYFSFPCQSSFHQFLHNHHHLSSGAGTIGQ